MVAKTTIRTRIVKIVQANIQDMIEKRTDPMKVLDLAINNLQTQHANTKNLFNQEIRRASEISSFIRDAESNMNEWKKKVEKSAQVYHQYEDKMSKYEKGSPGYFEAMKNRDTAEDLMRNALIKVTEYESEIKTLKIQRDTSTQNAETIRKASVELQKRFDEMNAKKRSLNSRETMLAAQEKTFEIEKMLNTKDSTSIINVMEDEIRRKEYVLSAQREIESESVENQLDALMMETGESEVEKRLLEMKSKKYLT